MIRPSSSAARLLGLLVVATAIQGLPAAVGATASGGLLGDLPATFSGTLPCADCPGVDHQLNLFDDGAFYLRTSYQERDGGPFDDIGSWSIGSDGATLVLSGGREAPLYFSVVDSSTLRQLDSAAREIDSALGYDLRRDTELVPFEPRLHLRGQFRYMADAAVFHECLSGRRLAVAQEGDYLALERAYLEADLEPGQEVLTNLEGAIGLRTPMEGEGKHPTLIVERFVGLHPDETCAPPSASIGLQGRRWNLIRLDEEAVRTTGDEERIHIVFSREAPRVHGFAGCNRFQASFKLEGAELTCGTGMSTTRACLDGMEEESRLQAAIRRTASHRILGQMLELFDANGNSLARFEAGRAE